MWEPEPDWHPMPAGTGPSTLGVWRAEESGVPLVVKRLAAPQDHDLPELSDRRHFAYWRRAADVASYSLVADTAGLRGPSYSRVEEDEHGITLVTEWVEDAANSGLFLAHAMGRFAAVDLAAVRWLARDQLRDRLARVERRGGWATLSQTSAAEVAEVLWELRWRFVDELDRLPQVVQHGDPVPANLPGRHGDRAVAVDWGSLGYGPAGADLGYYLLSAREAFEPLLDAYLLGLPDGIATRDQVAHAAQVTSVYTVFTRADWALSRVSGGEGPVGAKYRHPAVAPHLRALQRQLPAIEALLES
ncbi:phosphotransferase [Nocardioides insulae]|uniref:phosphotransferase n=1 Tax=Nocardioides insulae TaxID=394734 RepID=UPI0003FF922D|nr:phosphotransferase [Nocardioides insulae]